MSNLIQFGYEKSASYNFKDNYGYNNTRCFNTFPVLNERLVEIIHEHNIKIPFNRMIDASMGTSECTSCKAVYAGFQPKCNIIVRKVHIKRVNGYHTNVSVDNELVKGLVVRPNGDRLEVTAVENSECDGWIKWNLQSEFDQQKRFWDLIQVIANISVKNDFSEFEGCFDTNTKNKLEMLLIQQTLNEIIQNNIKHEGALIIAEKMNKAGHSLVF